MYREPILLVVKRKYRLYFQAFFLFFFWRWSDTSLVKRWCSLVGSRCIEGSSLKEKITTRDIVSINRSIKNQWHHGAAWGRWDREALGKSISNPPTMRCIRRGIQFMMLLWDCQRCVRRVSISRCIVSSRWKGKGALFYHTWGILIKSLNPRSTCLHITFRLRKLTHARP